MSEIEKVKKKRSVIRRLTTTLINSIEEFLISDKTPETENNIYTLRDQLLEKSEKLKLLDDEIQGLIDEKEFEDEVIHSEEYHDKIVECKSKISLYLNPKSERNTVNTQQNENFDLEGTSFQTIAPVQTRSHPNMKLPKLSINTYYGDPALWLEFWHQYKNAIHENSGLSDINKFNYLKSLLGGLAASAINGLALTSDNYKSAIELLEQRFGRHDLLISTHINCLLSLEPVKNVNNCVELRKLYDCIETNIRNLETLNVTSGSYGNLLSPVLLKLIPEELTLEFNRKRKVQSDFDVKELIDFLKVEIQCREAAFMLRSSKNESNSILRNTKNESIKKASSSNGTHKNKYFKNKTPTAAALAASNVDNIYCIFCNTNNIHKTSDCKDVNVEAKKQKLKSEGRCFRCFKRYHLSKDCKAKIKPCELCNSRKHVKLFCSELQDGKNEETDSQTVVSTASQICVPPQKLKNGILLQTCSVLIQFKHKRIITRALLDSGSQRSYITSDLAKALKLKCLHKEKLFICSFGTDKAQEHLYDSVELDLQNTASPDRKIKIQALVTNVITSACLRGPDVKIRQLMIAKGWQVADSSVPPDKGIELLIGADFLPDVLLGNSQKLTRNLMAVNTVFGWVVQGRINEENISYSPKISASFLTVSHDDFEFDEVMSTRIKSQWDLETLGIKDEPSTILESDKETMQHFESNLKYDGERYSVKLPWKTNEIFLPDNYENAYNRLRSLIRRFVKYPELFEEYKSVLADYINLGIVEEVPYSDSNTSKQSSVYYLPHHPVIKREKETTSLRIVFDASSHIPEAPSLNDLLNSGPNLNPDLLRILLEFRSNEIAFVADIQMAFLQIELSEEDRDVVRFLWLDKLPRKNIWNWKPIILRMTRVLFGCTSSSFLLAAVLKIHIKKFEILFPETCEILNRSFYVDDLLAGASTVEKAFKTCKESSEILQQASMTLHKWKTNSELLEARWREAQFVESTKIDPNIETVKDSFAKVLGLLWNTTKDSFKFNVDNLLEFISKQDRTKRTVIRSYGRIFDPLGFLSPFIIRIKILFQELWERDIRWDDELPVDIAQKWDCWCEELKSLNEIEIPRYYFDKYNLQNITDVQLHSFSDSSNKAYGCVLYLRFTPENEEPRTVFIASKSRVAPLKRLSIPRLELMGALIASRFVNHVLPAFKKYQVKTFFWVDSTIVLSWIRSNPSQWKQFVSARVREIQHLSHVEDWRFCPGHENPADAITRGKSAQDLKCSSDWFTGPPWLKMSQENWPPLPANMTSTEGNEELRRLVTLTVTSDVPTLLEATNYSKLSKLIRITAWIFRFIKNLKPGTTRENGSLTIDELNAAEMYWIQVTQDSSFQAEISNLTKGRPIENNSKIKDLNPYLDANGILRVQGRLKNANLTYSEKHPILLPHKHHFSKLIVKDSHERNAHLGVSSTITDVRERFWILRIRQVAKTVIRNCPSCKFFHSKPHKEITAPLPLDRVNPAAPFEVTGVDFAGPLFIKDKQDLKKSYICLFTCATTRGIHLELTTDLTAESFILAFKRFVGRRAVPRIVYSDNAKTFQKAEKELKELFSGANIQKLKDYFGTHKIEWKFITPLAPWAGGFWERMIKTVKGCLRKTLGKAQLTYSELETVLIQIEAIINSRPITFIYNELHDPVPLTPSDFLVGKRLISLPDKNYKAIVKSDHQTLEKRFRYQQKLLDSFWNSWKKLYLLDLRSNHYISSQATSEPKIGSVVLIEEKKIPRLLWKLGRIDELYKGRDDKVRSCRLYLADGTYVKRPIQLLYPIEVENSD